MKRQVLLSGVGFFAVCAMALVAVTGCGEQSKAPPAPAAPGSPVKTTASMGNMDSSKAGDAMTGPTAAKPGAATAIAAQPMIVTTVYACETDKVFSLTAGDCPKCKAALKEMKIGNPDPEYCVVTGEKIEKHTAFGIAKGKAYAFCCDMCLQNLLDDPDGVVKKAQERADAAKAGQK